jgi:molybdopterin synthase catalytic subunit
VIRLQADPLDLTALCAAVEDPEHGGTAAFLGTTRRQSDLHTVEALDYEAYEELALSEMEAVAGEAEARYGAHVALAHRVGRVPVGEASVAVAASAPHRAAAFAACRYAIDELKVRVPIWKREVHADGEARWLDGRAAEPRPTVRARSAGPQ